MIAPLVLASILSGPVGPSSSGVASPVPARLSTGRLSEPLQGELLEAARTWALAQRDVLGLPATSTLAGVHRHGTRWGASLRLQQQVDGVDVHAAQVVVTVGANRRVNMVSSSALSYQRSVMTWSLTAAEALRRAARAIPTAVYQPNGQPYGGARPRVFAVGGDAHAGYLAMVPTVSLADNWFVAIDAVTGELLWRENRVFRSALDANVYATHPGGPDAGVGVTPTLVRALTHPDGGSMVLPDAGGYLNGTQLIAYNCCPNQGCSTAPDAGPKRQVSILDAGTITIVTETVACDRIQRATNDVLVNDAGTYQYPPRDPPIPRIIDAGIDGGIYAPVYQSDLANSDEFAEVHAFYQLNRVYDWVRELSAPAAALFPANVPPIAPFQMRDELRLPPRKPAVLVNVIPADGRSQVCNFVPPGTYQCTSSSLARIDNAGFLPRENLAMQMPPDQLDVDTLLIYQGNFADFAYDSTVLWHEFGHGVVNSTAGIGLSGVAFDGRSVNNEGGALHEALADFIAGAFGQNPEVGGYVASRLTFPQPGPKRERFLRSMDNTQRCPDVLWGEVHQDSEHVSGALWEARTTWFLGSDSGRTFDAAIYASIVSMSPQVDFAVAATTIAAHVKTAFPAIADAEMKMQQVFTARGVTGCSKVVDLTGALMTPRPYYGISSGAALGLGMTTVVPGPHQFKLKVPAGMKSLTITAQQPFDLTVIGGSTRLFVKSGGPIAFTKTGAALTDNADTVVTGAVTSGRLSATASLAIACGATSEVYFTLGATFPSGLLDVSASFVPADDCGTVDGGAAGGAGGGGGGMAGGGAAGGGGSSGGGSGGVGGGGAQGTGGGTEGRTLPWIGAGTPAPAARTGCGCSGLDAPVGLLVALLLATRRRLVRALPKRK